MKTLIFSIPATTDLDNLTPEQQAALQSVGGALCPIGRAYLGRKLVDMLANDNYSDALRQSYFPDWIPLFDAAWDGQPDVVVTDPTTGAEISRIPALKVMQALGAIFLRFMPDNPDGSRPTAAREFAQWAGWPPRF